MVPRCWKRASDALVDTHSCARQDTNTHEVTIASACNLYACWDYVGQLRAVQAGAGGAYDGALARGSSCWRPWIHVLSGNPHDIWSAVTYDSEWIACAARSALKRKGAEQLERKAHIYTYLSLRTLQLLKCRGSLLDEVVMIHVL